jgi:hypothetical protein
MAPTRFRVLVAAIAALVLLAVGLDLAAWFMRSRFLSAPEKTDRAPTTFFPAAHAPPEPRLEANPMQDLQAVREKEDALLHHYRWIDRSKGVVQIPIDRAMELLGRQGLPARRAKADR